MKIRFQADEDFNEDIVNGVLRRVPEIDFKKASEASIKGLDDLQVLAISAAENRLLLTHDRRTMPKHFANFILANESWGIIVISQKADVARVIEDLILVWSVSEAEEYIDSIRTLPL